MRRSRALASSVIWSSGGRAERANGCVHRLPFRFREVRPFLERDVFHRIPLGESLDHPDAILGHLATALRRRAIPEEINPPPDFQSEEIVGVVVGVAPLALRSSAQRTGPFAFVSNCGSRMD